MAHVISTSVVITSPCIFTPGPGPEVSPCASRSSRELSPSPHLLWYAAFCPLIVTFMRNFAKKSPQPFRVERDTFGELQVPSDRYWGAQTQR
jgi:hypothetical protein